MSIVANPLSATSSRMIPEPLYGTLPEVNVYFLLEYNGVWGSHVLNDHTIPGGVMHKLSEVEGAKTLFIRQPGQSGWADNRISFYVAVANADNPKLYKLQLQSYENLLKLNLEAIIRGDFTEPTNELLYAVCTNGKRDICCSKYGVSLAEALAKEAHESVWRISHIGGHRFAATMLCLPHGIGYGHLDAEHAPLILESYSQGRILLDYYRGCSIYPKPAQAADYFLRAHYGLDAIDSVRLMGLEATDDKQWLVYLQTTADGGEHTLQIEQRLSDYTVIKTTGDKQAVQVPQFELVGMG